MQKEDDGSVSLWSVALILILIIVSIGMLVFIGETLMYDLTDAPVTNGVDMMVRISGDDVIAVVVGGDRVASLTSMDLYLHGQEDIRYSFHPVNLMEVLHCSGMAKGVEGWQYVVAEGIFLDGSTDILGYTRLRFS